MEDTNPLRHDARRHATANPIPPAPAEILIRTFEPGDATAFRVLNEEWILRYFGLEPPDHVVLGDPEGEILQPGGQILMALEGGQRVGCCALIADGGGVFELAKMAVTESHRGRGIGRQILLRAMELARSLGATRLRLSTNHALLEAIHLYESIGFRRQAPGHIEPSLYARADVFMELELDAPSLAPGEVAGA